MANVAKQMAIKDAKIAQLRGYLVNQHMIILVETTILVVLVFGYAIWSVL